MSLPGAHELCSTLTDALPVAGASVSVLDRSGRQSSICSSDAVAARIDEIQFELGEGPQWDALRTRHVVLIGDLSDVKDTRWPVFAHAVQALPARALSTIPLVIGAATVGVVALYDTKPGLLSRHHLRMALAMSSAMTGRAVRLAIDSAGVDEVAETTTSPAMRREVHQATGMIVAQLGVSATIAFSQLQAHSFSSGRTLQDVAHDVVVRQLNFRSIAD